MKLDSTIKDLQKEKLELEAKLKQVNVALSALAKLSPKVPAESPESKAESLTNRPATPATAPKSTPSAPSVNKPAGI